MIQYEIVRRSRIRGNVENFTLLLGKFISEYRTTCTKDTCLHKQ